MKNVRTTITLEADVAERLRREMHRRALSFKATVNELLRGALAASGKPPKGQPFRVVARKLGLRPGMQLDNIGALLDQIEGPAHR